MHNRRLENRHTPVSSHTLLRLARDTSRGRFRWGGTLCPRTQPCKAIIDWTSVRKLSVNGLPNS